MDPVMVSAKGCVTIAFSLCPYGVQRRISSFLNLHFHMHTAKMANSKFKATKQCHVTCRSQLNRALRARNAKHSRHDELVYCSLNACVSCRNSTLMLVLVGHGDPSDLIIFARMNLGYNTDLPIASYRIAVLNQDDVSRSDISLFHVPLRSYD